MHGVPIEGVKGVYVYYMLIIYVGGVIYGFLVQGLIVTHGSRAGTMPDVEIVLGVSSLEIVFQLVIRGLI